MHVTHTNLEVPTNEINFSQKFTDKKEHNEQRRGQKLKKKAAKDEKKVYNVGRAKGSKPNLS